MNLFKKSFSFSNKKQVYWLFSGLLSIYFGLMAGMPLLSFGPLTKGSLAEKYYHFVVTPLSNFFEIIFSNIPDSFAIIVAIPLTFFFLLLPAFLFLIFFYLLGEILFKRRQGDTQVDIQSKPHVSNKVVILLLVVFIALTAFLWWSAFWW